MLFWLGEMLVDEFGESPLRLLNSRIVLSALGLFGSAVLTWFLLPRLEKRLPRDGGRINTPKPDEAKGKPTAAGLIFVPILIGVSLLVVPWHPAHLAILGCAILALAAGYFDDRLAWGDFRKGAVDFGVALAAAVALWYGELGQWWLPIAKDPVAIPTWAFLVGATLLLWISINATNCTDGVDGLSGSLLVLAFSYLGVLLYGVVGHEGVAAYLLVPHHPEAADWGILAFVLSGTLMGYLWFNAHPSRLLMGDAGSRPLGLLLGVLVLASGNPFLLLVVGAVVLVNGGTGLVKVALLRFFKIGILREIRFPLHDHCKTRLGWSNPQVLIRFVLLQALLTPILLVILLKVR